MTLLDWLLILTLTAALYLVMRWGARRTDSAVHAAYHAWQRRRGRLFCDQCSLLLQNAYRPMSHQIR